MKPTSLIASLSILVVAGLLWGSVFWFSTWIDASATTSAEAITKARQDGARRDADSVAIALTAATAEGRVQLAGFLNKDALSLSNAITEAGRDVGVEMKIGSVTQGPGPTLPKGAVLRPTSISFSLNAVGSFQKLFTLAALLSDLPAASSIERLQFARGSIDESWTMNADIRIITNSSL